MSTTTDDRIDLPEDEEEWERLAEHRGLLETLAGLDTGLSDDARRALELLEERDQS